MTFWLKALFGSERLSEHLRYVYVQWRQRRIKLIEEVLNVS